MPITFTCKLYTYITQLIEYVSYKQTAIKMR